jgi:hypothetical protein
VYLCKTNNDKHLETMKAQEIITTFGLTEQEITDRLEDLGYEVDDLDSAVYSEFRRVLWYSDLGLFLILEDVDFNLTDELEDEIKSLAD